MLHADDERNKSTTGDLERRRARNRLSQRAYRRRHAEQLRELRERAEAGSTCSNETFEKTRKENQELRRQLCDVQSKLASVTESLMSLTGSVTKVLDGTSPEGTPQESRINPFVEPNENRAETDILNSVSIDSTLASHSMVDDIFQSSPSAPITYPPEAFSLDAGLATSENGRDGEAISGNLETPSIGYDLEAIFGNPNLSYHHELPNIWSYAYQMGFQPYTRALAGCESSSLTLQKPWVESNSAFSDHISILLRLMKTNTRNFELQLNSFELLYRQVVAVLGLFNSLTRPEAMAWYAKTRFHHIVDLTTWQLCPCPQTLERVEKQYRPTMLQLQHQHPKVIDWIPFPSIRDRLIRLHSANPQIDQIFCDLVSSYTVEACMTDLILGAPAQKVYIRVLDVSFCAADSNSMIADPFTVLPVADAGSLFSNPECAQAVFTLLNMDHGVSEYKLDPSFFGTYPELFDYEEPYIAQGVPLRPNFQTRLPRPVRLDNLTFQTYRSFIEFNKLALTPC